MAFIGPLLWNLAGAAVKAAPAISKALTVVQGISAVSSFVSSRDQASAIASAGASNQQLAETEAQQALLAAKDRERIRRDDMIKTIGAQRAGYASAGVAVDAGSPLLAMNESIQNGLDDISAIREQGELQAYAARLGGVIQRNQASQLASATRTQATGTLINAGLNLAKSTGFFSPNAGVKIK